MENNDLNFDSRVPLEELRDTVGKIKQELSTVIIGQKSFMELLIVSLLVDGHALIEGVPGIAKTIMAKLFAKTIKTEFSRIQFTPDLMPSDILGTSVFNVKNSEFEFKKGPIFSNVILIDEINRAPAKTQAALFETMEERQATIDGTTYKMSEPFMVLATQNPIEQEGTYALPEAQLDRFLFKIKIDYPTSDEEFQIIQGHHDRKGSKPQDNIKAVLTPKKLAEFKKNIHDIIVEEKIINYIANIITNTRNHPHLYLGASPRASIATLSAAKAFAAISGRDFVIPEDVKKALAPVLNHRVILTPEREMEGMTTEDVIHMIVESVEIPR
ncbi:MoxR family ATPase [Muricauda sp. 2012CJ35-5]|uniref:MoxR family ATPase n=1 Tax=Flagellimonas spongiicola TaxID=2942208 RepID=A0ABT0PVB2_9FLAO|nr:MoxR family ATPase [Allomuricauda spongiicola]MCL6275325.1 MoxR family ATPase [Allomuricauda spongiicola]